jgi:hypothetical protein
MDCSLWSEFYSKVGTSSVVVIIISIRRGVATLMMKRDGREGIIASVEAHTTLHVVLLHLGLGARPTSKVSVASNRRERGGSGEVVFGQWREAATSVVIGGHAVLTATACKAAVFSAGGVERRRVGGDPAVRGETAVVHGRLPVDGLETILELGRGTELPFANYGPDDSTTSDRRGEYDDDGQGGVGQTRAPSLGIVAGRGRGGSRDVTGQCYRIDRGRWGIDDGQLLNARC